jgi:hypothetical protein
MTANLFLLIKFEYGNTQNSNTEIGQAKRKIY